MKKRKAVWGGRFKGGPADSLRAIGDSLRFDARLAPFDIMASIAHVRMLGKRRIIGKRDADAIVAELERMLGRITAGELVVEGDDEDVHSWIERTLTERIGDAGKKVHTARSRNDQVATAFRLWTRHQCVALVEETKSLMRALTAQANATIGVIVPAYTHLQRGQPALLSHQLLAYVEMLGRDVTRSIDVMMSAAQDCPLGAGAATGVPYPVDRDAVAADPLAGFAGPAANSMDAVSDRDFAVEALAALSLLQVHLSRLAEDVCLWSSSEWGLLDLGDSVSTGSSIMPQKRNPDGAELTRGKTGRVIGHLVGLLTTLKGLPMTYNRDLQEDKEAVFDAYDTVVMCLRVMTDTIAESRFRPDAAARLLKKGHLLATELADFLVQEKGVAFRDAHEAVGRLVRALDEAGKDLSDVDETWVARFDRRFAGCAKHLDFLRAVNRRDHVGGTATRQVKRQLSIWKRRLAPRR
jgi:argininosuccinate lyase